MPPRTNFPGAGPDQTMFFTLLGLGFALAVVGYLVGSRTLRVAGILIVFLATGIFLSDVLSAGS